MTTTDELIAVAKTSVWSETKIHAARPEDVEDVGYHTTARFYRSVCGARHLRPVTAGYSRDVHFDGVLAQDQCRRCARLIEGATR